MMICSWAARSAPDFATITARRGSAVLFLVSARSMVLIVALLSARSTFLRRVLLGEVEGISEHSRRTERAALFVHSPLIRVSLPCNCSGEPPQTDASERYPKAWLQEFLYSQLKELETRGVSVQAVQLAPQAWQWLREWDGKGVTSVEEPPSVIKPDQVCKLLKEPQLVILGHDEGRILTSSHT